MGHPSSMSFSKRRLNWVRGFPGLRSETWGTRSCCSFELAQRKVIVAILAVLPSGLPDVGDRVDMRISIELVFELKSLDRNRCLER